MIKEEIKSKQIRALFIALLPLTKLITAPAVFSGYCQEKLWQPLLILFVFDLLLLLLLLYAQKKNGDLTFFEILTKNFSANFAKVIYFIYALFFLAKAVIPLVEQKELIENAFYETLPQAPIFFPLFIVIFYISIKGFKPLARLCDFCLWITLIGLTLILFLSLPASDFKNLLPIFYFSNKNAPICALNALSWFSDGVYFLFFLGCFKRKKGDNIKTVLSFSAVYLIVLAFFVVFYAIFSYIAPTQEIALTSMSLFGVTLVNVGRFDYIALFLLALSSAVAVSLPVVLATHCLTIAVNVKSKTLPAIICVSALFLVTILFSSHYEELLSFVTKYLTPLFILGGYILPLLCLGGKKIEVQTG